MKASALITLSLQSPRQALRYVLSFNLSQSEGLTALGLVATITTLIIHFGMLMVPHDPSAADNLMVASPFGTVLVQFAGLLLTAFLVYYLGKLKAGRGTLAQSFATIAWLQAVMLVVQIAVLFALILVPQLSPVLSFVTLGLYLWLMSTFVAELHGFRSALKVFLAIMLTSFGLALILSFVLAAFLGPEFLNNV